MLSGNFCDWNCSGSVRLECLNESTLIPTRVFMVSSARAALKITRTNARTHTRNNLSFYLPTKHWRTSIDYTGARMHGIQAWLMPLRISMSCARARKFDLPDVAIHFRCRPCVPSQLRQQLDRARIRLIACLSLVYRAGVPEHQ